MVWSDGRDVPCLATNISVRPAGVFWEYRKVYRGLAAGDILCLGAGGAHDGDLCPYRHGLSGFVLVFRHIDVFEGPIKRIDSLQPVAVDGVLVHRDGDPRGQNRGLAREATDIARDL